jgi:SPP1 gp7 family putative phage head morphogenesis protein
MNVAHQMTDNLLIQLEQRINSEYSQAAREIEDKLNAYLSRMEDKYADKLELVRNGEMTPAELSTWFNNQLLVGNRWAEMRDTLAQDLTNTNQIAASMINGHTPEVYALNHNYGTFEIEEQSQIDTSYTLYDRWTVERLLRDDPDLLPQARIDIPEDSRWNRGQINSAITQGVLQGESIPAIARRLENVTNMNRTSAIRNARTMTTSAECGGRIDSYRRAEEMGVQMEQVWIATHDDRTRFTHAMMDGERAKVGELFSNGLEYPGDPNGDPAEVYNCRCTIVALVAGADTASIDERGEYWDNDERYQEWVRKHEEPQVSTEGTVVHGQDISAT